MKIAGERSTDVDNLWLHYLQVSLVQKQYDTLFDLLKLVAACQKPDQKTFETLLAPFPKCIEAVSRAKEAGGRRDKDWFSHLIVLAEGAPVIGWVINVSFTLGLVLVLRRNR